mgnify:CR=1 FL=1
MYTTEWESKIHEWIRVSIVFNWAVSTCFTIFESSPPNVKAKRAQKPLMYHQLYKSERNML